MKRNFIDYVLGFLAYTWLVIASIVVLIPILWMISAAFTSGRLLSSVPLIPDPTKFTMEHYQFIFEYKSNAAQLFADFPGARRKLPLSIRLA